MKRFVSASMWNKTVLYCHAYQFKLELKHYDNSDELLCVKLFFVTSVGDSVRYTNYKEQFFCKCKDFNGKLIKSID